MPNGVSCKSLLAGVPAALQEVNATLRYNVGENQDAIIRSEMQNCSSTLLSKKTQKTKDISSHLAPFLSW